MGQEEEDPWYCTCPACCRRNYVDATPEYCCCKCRCCCDCCVDCCCKCTKKNCEKRCEEASNAITIVQGVSLLYSLISFVCGIRMAADTRDVVFTRLVAFPPKSVFLALAIVTCFVHLICFAATLGMGMGKWMPIAVVTRVIAIFLSYVLVFVIYDGKGKTMRKIAEAWSASEFQIIVAQAKAKLNCCGWNVTTDLCSGTKCMNALADQIDGYNRRLAVYTFIMGGLHSILLVYSVLICAFGFSHDPNAKSCITIKRRRAQGDG